MSQVKINKIFESKQYKFSYPSRLTLVLGAEKNCLIDKVLLSTHNMCWLRNKKITFCCILLSKGLNVGIHKYQ